MVRRRLSTLRAPAVEDRPSPPRWPCLVPDRGAKHSTHRLHFSTVEGPFLIRRGNTYYLFFSGNDFNGAYAMGYATAASPTGPFTVYKHNPILKGTRCVLGPGGGSVVEGPDGRLWMVYHAWSGVESYDSGSARTMRIDPLIWHGAAVTIHPTGSC